MNKQIYCYHGKKEQHKDAFLHLSDAEIKKHKLLVNAIVATGVIRLDEPGDYAVEVQDNNSIMVFFNKELIGVFVPASIN